MAVTKPMAQSSPAVSPQTVPATLAAAPAPALVWKGVFLTDERLTLLKERIASKAEPTYSAFQKAKAEAGANLQREPQVMEVWYVPGYYTDPAGHKNAKLALQNDGNAAYGLALIYRLTGEERYAAAAVRLINAWASGLKTLEIRDDSKLSFSYHFPAFVFAASLLQPYDGWKPEERKAFSLFLRARAFRMNTMDRANNWGNWGLVLFASIGAYLRDERLMRAAQEKWCHFIDTQMDEQGVLTHEVKRGNPEGSFGLWYSSFSLMPQTLAAEILRVNGIDTYEYRSPNGQSLRLAYEKLVPWVARPETFPYYKKKEGSQQATTDYVSYWEILQNRWPSDRAVKVLESRRPTTALHCAPYLTLTHGGMPPDL